MSVIDQSEHQGARRTAGAASVVGPKSFGALGPLAGALQTSQRAASPAEQRMWWAWRAGTAGRAHHTSFGLDIRGDVDADVLRKTLRLVMARHESLRARFVETGSGLMVQHASLAELTTPFRVMDLRVNTPDSDSNANDETVIANRLRAALVETFAAPFDLATAPLWRAILFRCGAKRNYLHVAIHHSISDAASFGIFFRDLYAGYSALLAGRDPESMPAGPSTAPPMSKADEEDSLAYWLEMLRDAPPPVCLRPDISPADAPQLNSDREGEVLVRPLNSAWRKEFEQAAAASSVTTYEAMIACLTVALHRFTGQTDIILGSMTAGRRIPEDESAIGCFAGPVALRVAIDSAIGLPEHLAHVADRVRQGLLRAHAPFQRIVERLAPVRGAEALPLFSTLFILQSLFGAVDGRLGDAEATMVFEDDVRAASEYELFIQVTPRDGFDVRTTFRRAKYSRQIIADFLDAFVLVMQAFASGCTDSVGTVDILEPSARAALLFDLNATNRPRAESETIVDLFERAAARELLAVAVHARGRSRKYGEVNRDMCRTAARLRAAGIAAGDRVGILMDRDVHLPGAALAILRLGAIYVPLDPEHPKAYLSQIIDHTKLAAVVCDQRHEAAARELASSVKILIVDEAAGPAERDAEAEMTLAGVARPAQTSAAYIIFTSGSSGLPKGVLVGHRSLHNLVCWAGETFTSAELRGVLCASSVAFDSSIFELFAPLGNGGAIVLVENLLQLVDCGARLPVTLLVTGAPSAFLDIVRAGGVPPTTTSVILAGEPVSRAIVDDIYGIPSIERVFNVYGPTEATVYATSFAVPRDASGAPSIGTPIANTRAYVLDERGGVAPFGVIGELVLGGRQLALGYFGRPELSEERFSFDPHVSGERIYRTGDLAARTHDGRLWFHGRKDGQIKLRGVRIEVEEIEALLLRHEAVRLAAVKLVTSVDADPILVAYVVPRDPNNPPDADGLRAHLAALLPRLKLPNLYEIRPNLPLNANGKLDRAKLPSPAVRPARRPPVSDSRTVQTVTEVWRDVLRHGDFTPDDAFFDRGGHSMLLLQLQAGLRARLGRAPEIMTFFEAPTVRDIAAWYDGRGPRHAHARAAEPSSTIERQSRHAARRDDTRNVAIVGFSCRLPGANDLNALRAALETGVDVVKTVPLERWSPSKYASAEEPDGGAMQWLAALDDIASFDPAAFGMTRREADLADPQLRLLLELTTEAVAGCGRPKRGGLPRETGVYVGASFTDYATLLARAGIADGHKSTGNAPSMLANRLSREFGLMGPSLCLDTACSSGLVALDMAWRAIVAGEVEAAVVCGVALMVAPDNMADWQAAGMLSQRGRCQSFSAEADGFGVGEGGIVLVLKSLTAAESEGDPIHAVVCGTAVRHDGGESIGVAAPNVHAQASVVRAALDTARLRPDDVDVVEAHGTGTPLGDPIEWQALADVFGGRAPTLPPCRITAAKSVFGHLGPAAGLLGVAAMLAALRAGRTAPIRGLHTPNPHLAKTSALALGDAQQSWQSGARRRICGVNSIGFGGVYAHAIIAEAIRSKASNTAAANGPCLLVLAAQNAKRLVARAQALLAVVETADVAEIHNLCATAAWQCDPLPLRCAILARDAEQLGDRLALLANADPEGDFAALRRRFILIGPAADSGGSALTSNDDSAEATAMRFVQGETVDWSILFPRGQFQRAALPTSFQRIRCWALDDKSPPRRSSAASQRRAPQLDSAIQVEYAAGLSEPIWIPANDAAGRSTSGFAPPAQPARIVSSSGSILITGDPAAAADLVDRFTASGRLASQPGSAPTPCTQLVVVAPSHPIVLVDAVRRHTPRECVLVTNTAQAVVDADRSLDPLQAACWGLVEVLAREYPDMATRAIDIDRTAQGTDLVNEILAEDGRNAAIALRSGQRFAPATRALEVKSETASLVQNGRYLVTGGTGGIAAHLIPWLIDRYKARVFVVARRAPTSPNAADHADGVWFGDITAPGAASRLVDEVHRTIGGIDGVFHLSGRFVRARIADVTRDDFDAALTPKLDVALALDAVLAEFEPRFWAAFGSWAAYRAPAGYGPYAAANRALSAFVAERRAAGKPYTTIVWPGWHATGMGAGVLDSGEALPANAALACIEPALGAAVAEVLVSAPLSLTHSAMPDSRRHNAGERAPTVAPDWRVSVASRIAAHLGIDVARLRDGVSFVDLGLDSIGARSLARAVAEAAGVNLSPLVFFTYGTLDRILARCSELRASNGHDATAGSSAAQASGPEPVSASAAPAASDWRVSVASCIAEHLGVDVARLRGGASFVDLGLDSIGARSLARSVADAAGAGLSPLVFFTYGTLEQLLTRCSELRASNGRDHDSQSASAPALGPEHIAMPAAPVEDGDIGIIGMACRFPGSEDTGAFWDALVSGRDCTGPAPIERREADLSAPTFERCSGGFLPRIDGFDGKPFGILPAEARMLDPQQAVLLETTLQALEDAGVADDIRGGRVGVFVGASANPFPTLDGGPLTAHSLIGRSIALLANRISHAFDLTGPSQVVDTLCSSSLVALHQALRSLRANECDFAIVAGIRIGLSAPYYEGAIAMQVISPSGSCRPFGEGADGMVPGEGCGVLVLERQDKARAAARRVRAGVAGTAVLHQGRSPGVGTPVAAAQAAVIRSALADARLDASQIDYIEGHGTGTALGDPIEIEGLAQVFSSDRRRLLGSVKSNIGHLEPAAGIASLIKVVLALENRRIPASLHAQPINPLIDLAAIGFEVPQSCVDWPVRSHELPAAGISAFGIGGTLAHAVLRAAPATPHGRSVESATEPLIVPVQAYSSAALARVATRYAAAFGTGQTAPQDLCHSIAVGRLQKPVRAVAVGRNHADLVARLHEIAHGAARRETPDGAANGKPRLAFSFSGQGGYRSGSGADLYRIYPAFRAAYDRCRAGFAALGLHVPMPTDVSDDTSSDQMAPLTIQPAMMALQIALTALYEDAGVRPCVVTGHSLGEIAAAVAAGALSLDDGITLVAMRARQMQTMPTGAMLAIRAEPKAVKALLARVAAPPDIAVLNAPDEVVLSGNPDAIARAASLAEQAGLGHAPVPVNRAFHSRATEPILPAFYEAIAHLTPRNDASGVSFISAMNGRIEAVATLTPTYWSRHIREPVRFTEAAARIAEYADIIIDIGPDGATHRLGPRSTSSRPNARWVGRNGTSESFPLCFARIVGDLFVAGVPIRWSALHPGARRIEVPPYLFDVVTEVRARPVRAGAHAGSVADAAANDGRSIAVAANGEVEHVVHGMVAKALGLSPDSIAKDTRLVDLGADSLILSSLTLRLKERFGTQVPTRRFFTDLATVTAIAAHVAHSPPPAAPTALPIAQPRNGPPAAIHEIKPLPNAFISEYRERTQRSFERAVACRRVLADRRVSASFTNALKETQYPIVSRRASGGRFEDIDGNVYVDIAMGFGVQLFGHAHPPIVAALRDALARGLHLGPQAELAADAARRLTALTGMERVAFCNSGTEAVMLAIRLARAATRRDILVIFDKGYHGFWDGTLLQEHESHAQPLSPGIIPQTGLTVRVLPFGDIASLQSMMPEAERIAAVMVEPVPSRFPDTRPGEFLRALRTHCDRIGAALVFDEVLGGFRFHPAGAAGYLGVKPDLAIYGKILGGGLPIGAVAGRATYLDGVDGGFWAYGDASFPACDQVFFASTFAKNPLSMAAASAVLTELERAGPALQAGLADRTDVLVGRLTAALEATDAPIRVTNFTSLFGFDAPPHCAGFFRHLVHRGVYVWEGRTCFLSTAHTDEDLDWIVDAAGAAARAVVDPTTCSAAATRRMSPPLKSHPDGVAVPEPTQPASLNMIAATAR